VGKGKRADVYLEISKGKRADVYLKVRKRRGHIFF
jgi:hypothetical protein